MSRSEGKRTEKKNCWPLLKFIFISPFDIFSISIQWFYKNLFFLLPPLLPSFCSIAIRTVATVVELTGRRRQLKLSDFIFHTQTFLFALYFIYFSRFFWACFLEWKGIFAGSNDCDDKFVHYITRSLYTFF